MRSSGRCLHDRADIVVLAIHANEVIRRTCTKVLWLQQGKAIMFGATEDVLGAYEKAMG